MRQSGLAALALTASVLGVATADAAVFFTVVPNAGSQVVQEGQPVSLSVWIRSNAPGGEQIDGVDVNVNAGPGDGSAGVFSSGATFLLGSTPFDITTTPGQAFSTNFQLGGTLVPVASGLGADLGVLYGTLTLSTVGVPVGTYPVTLDGLAANPSWNGVGSPPPVPDTFAVNSSYEIVPIPEPASLSVLVLAMTSLARRRTPRRTLRRTSR